MFLSSLYFPLLAEIKIWQTTETYSPQSFSVTAAVVAPAVVICLNSLIRPTTKGWRGQIRRPLESISFFLISFLFYLFSFSDTLIIFLYIYIEKKKSTDTINKIYAANCQKYIRILAKLNSRMKNV